MDEFIDLHMHSTFSDGDKTPRELVQMAREKGITTMSLTDHDTVNGCKNLFAQNIQTLEGVRFIPGIELTAKVSKGRMHILGYAINVYDQALNERLQKEDQENREKLLTLIHLVEKDYHLTFPQEEVDTLLKQGHNLGRPDLAKLCIKLGYANTVSEAFEKYLIAPYEKIRGVYKGILPEEGIALILGSGGVPVLAHPYTLELSDNELTSLLIDLKEKGLMGVEVYHSSHSFEERRRYLEIARNLNLYVSGGSDYHGPVTKPYIEMGSGKNNNLKIKHLSLLDHLSR